LGVLSLATTEEIESATTFLESCREEVVCALGERKLNVRLKGVASMETNWKQTSVVYAVPEEGDGRLRALSSE